MALSTITNYNLDINVANHNTESKISVASIKIHIIGNSGWVDFRNDGNCTGSGTYSNPYVIQHLVINAGGSGSGILIENSDVYFKIENCTVFNSGGNSDAGIKLIQSTNGKIINNNCSFNYIGIYVSHFSIFNTISGNTANNNINGIHIDFSSNNNISGNTANNNYIGIYMDYSSNSYISENIANNNDYGIFSNGFYNTISGNTANDNTYGIYLDYGGYSFISGNTVYYNDYGVYLQNSDKNKISENTVNNNEYGIYLYKSDKNNIWGNTIIGNIECIVEEEGEGNTFSDNGSCTYGEDTYGEDNDDKEPVIPGYNLFFLLGTLSIVAILMRKKARKSLISKNF